MADTDISITLAGQFQKPFISKKEQMIIACLGYGYVALATTSNPTVAQWNTLLTNMRKLQPPTVPLRDFWGLQSAIAYQAPVSSGITVGLTAGRSTSNILARASYLYGLTEEDLTALFLYVQGKAVGVFA